jgi:hypothetical protein
LLKKLFHTRLIFVDKDISQNFREIGCSTWVCSGLILVRLKMHATGKHSSLFVQRIKKSFITSASVWNKHPIKKLIRILIWTICSWVIAKIENLILHPQKTWYKLLAIVIRIYVLHHKIHQDIIIYYDLVKATLHL